MTKYRLCGMPGCGELLAIGGDVYCSRHKGSVRVSDVRGTPEENERDRALRLFRNSYPWALARRRRKRIDGFRCTFVDPATGERCTASYGLEVHHEDKLRDLYERSASWADFVALGTDVDRLRSTCEQHHPELEQESAAIAAADEGS